jgi:hypothetical protein
MNTSLSKGTEMLTNSVFIDSRLRGNDEVFMIQYH